MTLARRLLALVLVALGLGLVAAPGAGGAQDVRDRDAGPVHVRLEGQLSAASQSLLRRAISRARPEGRAVVLELDTPGGEVTLMWRLARAIDAARADGTTFVAFVDDKALSAGSLVAMSCDEIYMTPGATIGAATPITIGMEGIEKAEEKFLSSFRAEWRAWAERNGRWPAIAEGMVDESVEVRWVKVDGLPKAVNGTEWDDLREKGADVEFVRTIADSQTLVALTADEALEYGYCEGEVESLEELVELNLGFTADAVESIEPTSSEELVALLAPIAPFLLVAGVLLALIELQAPGFGVAGVGSVAAFALLLASRYLAGLAGWEHVVAIGLGLVLIAVEVFVVPGTFVAGISGAALFLWGLVSSQLGPGFDFEFSLDRKVLVGATISTLAWTLAGFVGGMALGRLIPGTPVGRLLVSEPTADRESFSSAVGELARADKSAIAPGQVGRATTALRPVGRVLLDAYPERELEASVDGGSLDAGARVRVLQVRTGRIVVEAVTDGGDAADEAASDADHGVGGARA